MTESYEDRISALLDQHPDAPIKDKAIAMIAELSMSLGPIPAMALSMATPKLKALSDEEIVEALTIFKRILDRILAPAAELEQLKIDMTDAISTKGTADVEPTIGGRILEEMAAADRAGE